MALREERTDDHPDELLDWQLLWNWTRFAAMGPRRRPRLAAGMLLGCVLAAAASLKLLPKSYQSDVKLLAERNLVMPALGNPSRAVPGEADMPTRAATESILKRENLIALIEQTNLVEEWERSRAPLQRVKDRIVSAVAGKRTREEQIDVLVEVLAKRLLIATDFGTITISIEWPDARVACAIVSAAHRNFVESRHAMEVSMIVDAIGILEKHAQDVRAQAEEALAQTQRVQRRGRPSPAPAPAAHARPAPPDAHTAELATAIAATRRTIEDLDEARRRRLADLKTELAQQLGTYAPAHPTVATTRDAIEALSRESPEVAAMKAKERELLTAYARRTGREFGADPAHALPPRIAAPRDLGGGGDDDVLEYARAGLRMNIAKYDELIGRIASARIELDTARASLKYRYSVIRPPLIPVAPTKPKASVTMLVGVFAGVFLALFSCLAADVLGGRLLETWQIERGLNLPVLLRW